MSGNCRYVLGEVGLVSGLVRWSQLSDGTCSAWSAYCRDVIDEVGLVWGRGWRRRLKFGTFR